VDLHYRSRRCCILACGLEVLGDRFHGRLALAWLEFDMRNAQVLRVITLGNWSLIVILRKDCSGKQHE
jgi:hypothetical protein